MLCPWVMRAPHSHSASLHPGVYCNWVLVHPIQGGVENNTPNCFMLQKPVKLRSDGSLGLYPDLTYLPNFCDSLGGEGVSIMGT